MDLTRIERYYDTAPRRFARSEEVGPFTLFVGRPGGWPFYARPRLGGTAPFDAPAVAALIARMRELEVPLAVEWVADLAPGLLAAVRADGTLTTVEELPLMVLAEPAPAAVPRPTPRDDVVVRMLGPDDAALLPAVGAVQALAFGTPTEPPAGPAERDAARREPSAEAVALLVAGESRVAVAEHPELGVVAVGRHLPVDGVSEVVGVAVLPALQGHGLGAAVTAALVADATGQTDPIDSTDPAGATDVTVFLTARDERVAALYRRLGFRRVGTGYVAEA